MKKGINTYILTSESKNPMWALRHKDVMVNDPKTKKPRRIVYKKGAATIYVDKMSDEELQMRHTANEFKDGKMEVPETNGLLNEYLKIHPEFGKKFKLLAPAADARKELKYEDTIFDSLTILNKLAEEELLAMAAILFGDRATRLWDPQTAKLKLNHYIKVLKQENDLIKEVEPGVIQAEYFARLSKEPTTQLKFMVIEALRNEVIELNPDKTVVRWADNHNTIIPVATGKNYLDEMAEFLMSSEGGSTLKKLEKVLV